MPSGGTKVEWGGHKTCLVWLDKTVALSTRELHTTPSDDPVFMTSQIAAPPAEERVAAMLKSTITRQAAAISSTRPTPPAWRPPKTPVKKPRTAAEETTNAEAGAYMGTARTTGKNVYSS